MSKHKPATREELANYCLRQLGAPVIEINIDDDQINDCLDTALQFYQDQHYDGTEHVYLAERITPSILSLTSGNGLSLTVGEMITGNTSSATCYVHSTESANVVFVKDVAGDFIAGEAFHTSSSGLTGNLAVSLEYFSDDFNNGYGYDSEANSFIVLGTYDNKYISLDDSIIGVEKVIPLTNKSTGLNMFDVQYQLMLNNIWSLTSLDVAYYAELKTYLNLINDTLNAGSPIRYNRHMDKLYIDVNWTKKFSINDFVIIEGFKLLDPDAYTDVYNDPFLKKYLTALLKKMWGTNMKKFGGMQLPGGVIMNGQQIYDEAIQEIAVLEEQVALKYQEPIDFFVG